MYIAYHFTITPKEIGSDILLAELEDTAFESFEETENGLSAYVQQSLLTDAILAGVSILDNPEFSISYEIEKIETVNWNEEWEKNFSPIQVREDCYIRAPFHETKNAKYEIVIEPKMSFGTGHHQTTHMMLEHLLDTDLANKKTLDMGCGTAVLAILAEMKGAKQIDAIDIDNWCYLNSLENVERNNCSQIAVYEGDVSLLEDKKYDVIIANINRNILLNDMQAYAACLDKGGLLFLSGFYQEDIPVIDQSCVNNGLKLEKQLQKDNWVALKYIKQ
ncbi:MAG TPA: 50S ribosomal protein L11 methyltransferase [Flavobacterium sp.]|nr:50S ribosomal protein L11 methyltransferase [Flavobacterium sp.]